MIEFKVSENEVAYQDAVHSMEQRVEAIRLGDASECIWFLEHPPIYTGGTSAKEKDLLNPSFPVFETGRGGEYTYHGPGQRIAYVMLDLKRRQKTPDLKQYIWSLEEWIIQTLAEFGIVGERRCGRVGIWVITPGGEKKIAAIGVRVRRWVTYHGIAINVAPDLSHFSGVVPCGISDYGVTSMADLGHKTDLSTLDTILTKTFKNIFAMNA